MKNLVQGWTEPLTAQLLDDGAVQPLTGASVVFLLYDKNGAAVSLGGTATIADAATGQVQYAPAAGDFVAASTPHKARWKITDGAGKISFFPSGAAEVINVRLP